MNQIASLRRSPPAASGAVDLPSVSSVREQARAIDGLFKAIARRVLIDDDPASELPLRQFRVCAALFDGALSMKELSRTLGVSQSAVTQLADRLEASGMVTRGPVEEDRRVRSLELTPRARKLLQQREDRRIERVVGLLESLSVDQREQVLDALALFRDAGSQ